ncbi:uncharacterized protein LOC142978332 [Anticarsia gemmatalis]|uniref:uncharacterized protein LOC142978332 n=1 Tax=Anticarsia gemmatalis TaxID=129554 RepID=UPI003F761BFD
MSSYISFQALLRDLEIYEQLKKECEAERAAANKTSEDVVSSSDCTQSTVEEKPSTSNSVPEEDPSSRPQTPTECVAREDAPSPTYSFPSEVSDDEIESKTEEPTSTTVEQETEESVKGAATDSVTTTTAADDTVAAAPESSVSTQTDEPVPGPSCEKPDRPKRPLVQKPPEPPTLFVSKRSKWGDVVYGCKTREIQLKRVRPMEKGIIITAASFRDHEALTEMMTEENIGFHPFTIADRRKLRVAIHYIPSEVSCFEIKQSLLDQNLPVYDVTRLGRASEGTDTTYDIFVAYLDWNPAGRAIFRIESICDYTDIHVEMYSGRLRTPCDRCQLLGHDSSYCYIALKCDRCNGNHLAENCGEPYINKALPRGGPYYKHNGPKLREEKLGLYWVTRSGPLNKSTSTEDTFKITRFSTKASQASLQERDTVAKFFSQMDVDELLKIHKLITENEGDGNALFLMAMEHAHILEKLQSIKIKKN